MKRNIICIICPRGCPLEVEIQGDEVSVKGNACPKGEQYGKDECINPTRTLTSIVRVKNREDTMLSVKTEEPIQKEKIFEAMEIIRKTEVLAPVKIGATIIDNFFGTRIISTMNLD